MLILGALWLSAFLDHIYKITRGSLDSQEPWSAKLINKWIINLVIVVLLAHVFSRLELGIMWSHSIAGWLHIIKLIHQLLSSIISASSVFFSTSVVIQGSVNLDSLVMEHYFVFSFIFNSANFNNCFNCINCINCINHLNSIDRIDHCQNVNYIDHIYWVFNWSDLFQCTGYFISRWCYICFCFSSLSLSNWQRLLWKLDLNSLFGIFGLEFHSFGWGLVQILS